MSAFQPYAGESEYNGATVRWRCYATARVHGVRPAEEEPLPRPPEGKKWVTTPVSERDVPVACLVDEGVTDFSQILLQIEPRSLDG